MMAYQTELFSVTDKVIIVTGASEGLGRHFAKVLAGCGARVALGARTASKLESLVHEIRSNGGIAVANPLDVTRHESVTAFCDFVAHRFGRIDCLVNNAGVQVGETPSIEHRDEEWDKVMSTNLKGAWRMMQACAKVMKQQEHGGSIVNIASILGSRVYPWLLEYSASKAALIQMTRTLSLEWAKSGIRVNNLAPGYILTAINRELFESPSKEPGGWRYGQPDRSKLGRAMIKRIPMRRLGDVKDLDGALLLLCSEASRWMTSTTVTVDGGHVHSSL